MQKARSSAHPVLVSKTSETLTPPQAFTGYTHSCVIVVFEGAIVCLSTPEIFLLNRNGACGKVVVTMAAFLKCALRLRRERSGGREEGAYVAGHLRASGIFLLLR